MKHAVPLLLLFLALGCSSSDTIEDADVAGDTGPRDSGVTVRDAQPQADASVQPQQDGGFTDPATLFEGRESIGGVQIYIHLRGTTTSTMPPLLFVNSGPSLGHEYLIEPMDFLLGPDEEQPDRLLVLFDLRATGRSGFGTLGSTVTAISTEAHVTDVDNVVSYVEDLVGAPTVDFVGHGYGAAVAALYAAERPERVSRLVLSNPYPMNILQHARYHAEVSARLSTADRERVLAITREPECRGNVPACSLELWAIQGPHHLCEQNRALFDLMTFEYIDFRASFIYIDHELRDANYDWTDRLASISSDTMIISGPCDPTRSETSAAYSSLINGSTHVVIDETGHFPMVESPTLFRAAVKAALTYP